MMTTTLRSLGAAAIMAAAVAAAPAQAGVLGSSVNGSDFSNAVGSSAGWTYLGGTTAAFTLPGQGEVELRSSSYPDSFGYAGLGAAYANKTTIFGAGATVGMTAMIDPGFAPFVLFFEATGVGNDSNVRYTDGVGTGPGASQAGIEIFYKASSDVYAFFYDDAGSGSVGGPGDDNDFNDLVITYRPTAVPEPATLALFGAGLMGLGLVRRRRA